ncbi:MAG: TonB C-terminal domain-containing protein [Myxococcales bacterium]|nr:TonB C-terminal domain-containing protein [Myxococcales bacterium]
MTRELHVPLLLWICAGLVLHLLGGSGVVGMTVVEEKKAEERAAIREMVWDVRRELGVIQIDVEGGSAEDIQPPPMEGEEDESLVSFAIRLLTTEDGAEVEALDAAEELDPWKAWLASMILQPKEPEPDPEKQELPKPEPPPAEEQAKAEPDKPKAEPVPEKPAPNKDKALDARIVKDKRIAIDQVAKNADNKDNPNAPRVAEHANTVDEETQAKIRSQDQKSKDPSPGSNMRGPADQEGNAERDKVGSAEERPGDPTRAPGESSPTNSDSQHAKPAAKSPGESLRSGGAPGPNESPGGGARGSSEPSQALPGLAGGQGPASPEVHEAENGGWTMNPSAPGGQGTTGKKGKPSVSRPGAPAAKPWQMGLGMPGTPGGPPSLSWNGFEKSVSEEQLRKEREATGQAIRAQHKGRFDTSKFARFLPDIENYDPSVKLGNQTSLNAAQSAFAKYLHDIHNRIHPIFADEFLNNLEGLPIGHPLRDDTLVAHVEIVLAKDDGRLVRRGITTRSGSTVFDGAALDAVERAGPYGKAPDAIVSKNGFVYLHWEFHRNLFDACSTRNAHPFLVKDTAPPKPNVSVKKRKKPTKKPGDEAPQPQGPLVPLRRK